MCATSAVSDYYTQTWPQRFPRNPQPFQTGDEQLRRDMAKVLELLDKIDKRLGDIECMDEQKKAFMAQFAKAYGVLANCDGGTEI